MSQMIGWAGWAILAAAPALGQNAASAANPSPATVGAAKLDPAAVKPGTWYKRSPLPEAPKNPRMGYEGAWAYDPYARVILRWGGHNQGGGGEQNSEMWVYDPSANTFTLMEPNYRPPGACCNRDNVFDIANRRYVRFPSFSANHGWQWRREVYQMQSSAWTYDYATNQWRNMRPWPQANPGPLRGAAYDTDNQVTVVAQGEGVKWGTAVYDLYANTWTMMNAKDEPPERNTFGFAYDPVGRKSVSFGSQGGSDPRTWIYDLRANAWQGLELEPHPPSNRNGAVMAYDPLNRIMLCVALTWTQGIDPDDNQPATVPGALETWAFDPAKLTWTKLDPPGVPEPTGSRNRLLLFDPDLNVFVLENRTGGWRYPKGPRQQQEQQEWIFRYADYTPPKEASPAPPTDLKAETAAAAPGAARGGPAGAGSITLSWKPSPSADAAGYAIYRGAGEKPWLVDYAKVGQTNARTTRFDDNKGINNGTVYYYYVTAVNNTGAEGPPSLKVRTQPPVVVDVLVSAVDARKVELAWAGPAEDVVGYHVYRAPVAVASTEQVVSIRDRHKLANPLPDPPVGTWRIAGEFARLTESPIAATSFTDASVDLTGSAVPLQPDRSTDAAGKPYRFGVYAYRVTAINRLGVQSGPSPYYLTIPGPVSDLKSRERKGETDLRWTANRETGIQGYRVYRLEGRFDDSGVTLLTPEPIKATTYTDKIPNGPDDDAKRYYVVAVDALGQEGVVGSATWGAREYARYYVGFLGEWHQ